MIEWQKRGLPHSHSFFWLDGAWDDPAHIDRFVSAEIPSAFNEPALYETVTKHMIHYPCGPQNNNPGAPCCLDDDGRLRRCSKGFPKPYNSETTVTSGRYAQYRRRDGPKVEFLINGKPKQVGNEWVVPFSPYLSVTYDAHINVEVCASLNSLKYLHKYMHKGSDRATIEFNMGMDEITEYISGRWWGAMECAWTILGYPKMGHYPSVLQLVVHMPGEQQVTWDESEDPDKVLRNIENQKSQLQAFFEHNREHPDERLLYQEMPKYYTWNRTYVLRALPCNCSFGFVD
mgnify:CR=1 FL=1